MLHILNLPSKDTDTMAPASTKAIAMTFAMMLTLPPMVAGTIAASSESLPGSSVISTISKHYTPSKELIPRRDILREVMAIRGGQSGEPYRQNQPYDYGSSSGNGNAQGYENGFANYNPPTSSEYEIEREASVLQESVQDRHDKWRSAQMERYANMTPEQEYNPRDEQGRMKLLSSVSKGSRALIFFILMWRDIFLFEVTDQSIKGSLRKMLTRGLLTTVFLGNLAGVVTSVTAQGHSSKNRLKAILNLDKMVETSLLIWNLGRITLFPSKLVPREIFVAGILHSVFFLIQCQAFTRVTWDERVAPVLQQKQQQQRYNHRDPSESTTKDFETPGIDDSTRYSADPYQSLPPRTNSYS